MFAPSPSTNLELFLLIIYYANSSRKVNILEAAQLHSEKKMQINDDCKTAWSSFYIYSPIGAVGSPSVYYTVDSDFVIRIFTLSIVDGPQRSSHKSQIRKLATLPN
jgi:hypothetical protein